MTFEPNEDEYATLFDSFILNEMKVSDRTGVRIMDLGCGAGGVVNGLCALGYDAYGCDVEGDYSLLDGVGGRLSLIQFNPYRLPYPDNSFDFVVSTQVFEHVQNKEETFREIYRVLKPGGATLHVFPSKWMLPVEVHLFVPFMSWMWPNVPRLWLALWAILGVRNRFQKGWTWRQVVEGNLKFNREAVAYYSVDRYREICTGVFGNFQSPMEAYFRHMPGRLSALINRLPARGFFSHLAGTFRQRLILAQKSA